MKKIVFFAALAVAAVVSCQKENVGQEKSVSIKVNAETLPMTKVSVKDGIRPVWTAGESAALISTSDFAVEGTYSLTVPDISNEGGKAVFTFDNIKAGNYRIISPESASVSSTGVVFGIPANQTQKEPGISGSRACLVGGVKGSTDGVLDDIAVSSETTVYDAYFRLAGAVLQFNVYDSSNPTGEQIKSVSVSAAGAKLSGNITVDYDGAIQAVSGSGSSVSVTIENPEIVVADKASSKGIYAAVVPAEIAADEAGSVTYTVVTDGSVYEFVSKEARTWVNGAVNTVEIDLACATKIERQAPIMSSDHPEAKGDFPMTETEAGVYTIEHVWLSGQENNIYFAAGNSGFYYNAVDGWVSSEDPEFDVVYSNEPVALKIQQWGGKNYTEKYYTIVLNTNTNKLKVTQDRGERFWISGDNLSWDARKYEMDVDKTAGKATWSGYLKAGSFKLHGDETLTGDDWKGEWYFLDSSRENGISLNSDGDNKWNVEAGYYTLEFDYKADPMVFTVTKKDNLELFVNGAALTYSGNNEYTITTEFTKGGDFVLSGCKNLEYVRMDPDFLKDGKFNAKTGTYTFVLHLQSHDNTWENEQAPTNSWTLFKGVNNGGTYSTKILAGEGVAELAINKCVGWSADASNQPFMAEVEDNVFQFTGRYREQWWHLEPYDRWGNALNFKYMDNQWWGGQTPNGINLVDNTGKMQQRSDANLTWKDSNSKWDDWGTYRMTVDMNTAPATVTFDKL